MCKSCDLGGLCVCVCIPAELLTWAVVSGVCTDVSHQPIRME